MSSGDIVALVGWDQPFIVAALTDDGTTWLHGAPTRAAAQELAGKLPGLRVSINEVRPGPTVVRSKVLSSAEAAMARSEITSQKKEKPTGRHPGERPTLN